MIKPRQGTAHTTLQHSLHVMETSRLVLDRRLLTKNRAFSHASRKKIAHQVLPAHARQRA
jgi:hypothetical protein